MILDEKVLLAHLFFIKTRGKMKKLNTSEQKVKTIAVYYQLIHNVPMCHLILYCMSHKLVHSLRNTPPTHTHAEDILQMDGFKTF